MNLLNRIFLSTCLLTVGSVSVSAMSPQAATDLFVSDSSLSHASVGICVMDIDSAKIVASHAADQSDITASTMKTVTSATALETVGKDFTFSTRVYAVGEMDKHGTLKGNLVIRGGGDPTLGSRYFADRPSFVDSIVAVVKQAGIKKIKGKIIVDGSAIPFPPVSQVWMVEDLAYDYGAGCFGLCFADNVLNVSFDRSGEDVSDIRISPAFPQLQVNSHVQLFDEGDVLPTNELTALMDYETPALTLWGASYRKDGRYSYTYANPAPHLMLQDSVLRALRFAEIKVNDANLKHDDMNDTVMLLDYRSPKLSEIITSLLSRSDNMFTEMVLRAIALKAGMAATAENGISVVYDLWRNKGIDVSGLFMKDGCGLARNGKASARFLCDMLAQTYRDRETIGMDYATLFPLAGVNGTVKSLLAGTELQGSVALKSGSMGEVQCFAGYYPAQNPKYSVAILVNSFNGPRKDLRKNIEQFFLNVFSELSPIIIDK